MTEDEARILALEADLAAARREIATLREAASEYRAAACRRDAELWRYGLKLQAALAASPAAEEPQP